MTVQKFLSSRGTESTIRDTLQYRRQLFLRKQQRRRMKKLVHVLRTESTGKCLLEKSASNAIRHGEILTVDLSTVYYINDCVSRFPSLLGMFKHVQNCYNK